MQKLYCYVDESNSHYAIHQFIVGIVITDEDRDDLAELCREFEIESGKRNKWSDCKDAVNVAYMSMAAEVDALKGRLFFSVFSGIADYLAYAADGIKAAVEAYDESGKTTFVLYDALPDAHERPLKKLLRERGVKVGKVRGLRREQDEPLLMLADAVCGLARDTILGKDEAAALMSKAIRNGAIQEVR
jgi:hypothetical protein